MYETYVDWLTYDEVHIYNYIAPSLLSTSSVMNSSISPKYRVHPMICASIDSSSSVTTSRCHSSLRVLCLFRDTRKIYMYWLRVTEDILRVVTPFVAQNCLNIFATNGVPYGRCFHSCPFDSAQLGQRGMCKH